MSYYLSDHSALSKAAQETMNVSFLKHYLIFLEIKLSACDVYSVPLYSHV